MNICRKRPSCSNKRLPGIPIFSSPNAFSLAFMINYTSLPSITPRLGLRSRTGLWKVPFGFDRMLERRNSHPHGTSSPTSYRDYERAQRQLVLAAQTLPNEPLVFQLSGYIARRQGRWEESTRQLQRALELDPLNLNILQAICFSYEYLRRFPEAAAILDRALRLAPNDIGTRISRAEIDL